MPLQFNKKTLETSPQLLDSDEAMLTALEKGILLRSEARGLKDEAAEKEKKANKLLAPVLTALEVEGTVTTQHGSLGFLQNVESKSVSREKMERWLIEHGVAPTLISEAREAATSTRTSEYQVRFTPPKPSKK